MFEICFIYSEMANLGIISLFLLHDTDPLQLETLDTDLTDK